VIAMLRFAPIPLLLLGSVSGGCRGDRSAEPPVHLNPNMDQQKRFDPQEPNPFFADRRSMRLPVAGTIAVGELRDDDHLHRGKIGAEFATHLPMGVSSSLVNRGRERFDIFCSPCHDRAGTGQGAVVLRAQGAMVSPPNFHDDRILLMPVGQIFDVATNGVRTMKGYRAQVPVEDRWAIVAYIRALQVSQRVSQSDWSVARRGGQ
jgi:mono/diheme cytochrome c family protein